MSRTKIIHDHSIHRKNFAPGQKILLYNSRLHLFAGKLQTHWSRPLLIQTVFPHGAIEIVDLKNENVFKDNGQRLKSFFTTKPKPHGTFELGLCDPVYE